MSTEADQDGAALALALARGDQEGARFLLDTTADVFPVAWTAAFFLAKLAPGKVLSVVADRAWRATVDDATAPHAIVTDAVLAAAEDHAVRGSEIASKLIVAVSKGDDATTRRLRGDVHDWRPVAMWLAGALVEALRELGYQPAAVLAEYAAFRGQVTALDADIARRFADLPLPVAADLARRFEDDAGGSS